MDSNFCIRSPLGGVSDFFYSSFESDSLLESEKYE